jgi:D-3-phosphoglycerate dehydrogenase
MRVLIADGLDPSAVARIAAAGHEVVERKGLAGEALTAALEGCSALVVRSATQVTAAVLGGAPSLRLVVRAGTGLDNVDAAAAAALGVTVRNTPAANAVSVAELVIGALVAFERHVAPAAMDLRAGRWEKSRYASGRELAGRSLGLVGFGRIGREVARRARAFDMAVSACDPLIERWPDGAEWVRRVGLDAVLEEADVVSLHVPLVEGTRHLIDAPRLARMKRDAVLVNAARGGVVDEVALAAALEQGVLRGAILDVFEREPAPPGHPLLAMPNVLALPHLGASTREAQRRAGEEAAAIVVEALAALRR